MDMNIENLVIELSTKYGCNVKPLLTPSKQVVIIREQNGNDDDILSRVGNARSASSFNNFIAGIVVYHEAYPNHKPTAADVLKFKLRDKYFILMASRIFSLGEILTFEYEWDPERPKVEYKEDLTQYMWDYNEPFPESISKDYYKYRIKPYPEQGDYRELTLPSSKKVRYTYLNGHGEEYLLGLGESEISINDEIRARFLEIWLDNSKWVQVDNFGMFTTRDMQAIRTDIDLYDTRFDGLTDIVNPIRQDEKLSLPLIGIPAFFFPR